MSLVRAWRLRLAGLFDKERKDRELEDELESHLQMHIAENVRSGMSLSEARRQALIKLGGLDQTKERYRERRGILWLETLLQDVRFGARMLRKSPSFTAVAVLTLALGIGANTAIFSVANTALFRPLPYQHADRLVAVHKINDQSGQVLWVSYLDFIEWQRANHTFQEMAAWGDAGFNLTGRGDPEPLTGKLISASFFPALSVQPIKGRNFTAEEDQVGAAPVALISEALWGRRFESSTDIVGQNLVLGWKNYTIIGVVPSSFRFPRSEQASANTDPNDVFIPIGQTNNALFRERGAGMGGWVFGQLKAGVTLTEARADLDTIGKRLALIYPETNGGATVTAFPLKEDIVGNLQPLLLLLLGAVGFVLLIACTNVVNLLLARSTRRTREFTIRTALGASPNRVLRQLLTESALLSLLGGAVALLFAYWGTQLALRVLPVTLPDVVLVDFDIRVLAFAFGASILASLFGLAPAFKVSRHNPQDTLRAGGRSVAAGSHLTQSILTVTEIAFAVILLSGAGLMIRSLQLLWNVHPGFDSHDLASLAVIFPPPNEPNAETVYSRHRAVVEALRTIKGVESASLSFAALPMGGRNRFPFWLEGETVSAPKDARGAMWFPVGPGYFRTMRIPLMRGRPLLQSDSRLAPKVVVIDEILARGVFPGKDPLGKRINVGGYIGMLEIVGVVGHVKQNGLDEDLETQEAQFYTPIEQAPDWMAAIVAKGGGTGVVVRTSIPLENLLPSIRREIAAVDSRQMIADMKMLDDVITGTQARRRFSMYLLSGFAGLSLLLATVGIYGVISYVMSQRTNEIGIRMAVGAQKADIWRMVIARGSKLALVGAGCGIAGALALTRFLASLLYGVTPTDPVTFVVVTLLLLGVALLACYIPAWRATRVDPMVALRYE